MAAAAAGGAARAVSAGPAGPADGGLLDHLPDLPHGAFLSDDDFEVFVRAFEKSGFRKPLNWYRNIDRNAREHPQIGVTKLDLPCLMTTAAWDVAPRPEMAAATPALGSDAGMPRPRSRSRPRPGRPGPRARSPTRRGSASRS